MAEGSEALIQGQVLPLWLAVGVEVTGSRGLVVIAPEGEYSTPASTGNLGSKVGDKVVC